MEEIREYHSSNTVCFVVRMVAGRLEKVMREEGVEKKFKLVGSVGTSNMVMFD